MSEYKVGDYVKVFDYVAWLPIGDVGDNSQFFKPAKIVRLYYYDYTEVADVIFEDNPTRISRAHFTWAFRE